MALVCPKCGHQRTLPDDNPAEQCPQCGIFYEKFHAAEYRARTEAKRAEERERIEEAADRQAQRQSRVMRNVVLGAVAAGLVMSVRPVMRWLDVADDVAAASSASTSITVREHHCEQDGQWLRVSGGIENTTDQPLDVVIEVGASSFPEETRPATDNAWVLTGRPDVNPLPPGEVVAFELVDEVDPDLHLALCRLRFQDLQGREVAAWFPPEGR